MLGSHTSASSDSSVLTLHRQLLSKSSDVSAAQRIRNGHPSTTTKDKMISWRPWYYVCWKIHGKPGLKAHKRTPCIFCYCLWPVHFSLPTLYKGTTWITSQAIWIATISVVAFCVWYGHAAIQGDIPLASLSQNDFSHYWIIDFGTSGSYVWTVAFFTSYSHFHTPKSVWVANGSCTRALGSGSVWLSP